MYAIHIQPKQSVRIYCTHDNTNTSLFIGLTLNRKKSPPTPRLRIFVSTVNTASQSCRTEEKNMRPSMDKAVDIIDHSTVTVFRIVN